MSMDLEKKIAQELSGGYRALLTHLVQQANRVSDGLREASELIETAMEEWERT
jgi:hypothetical protein